MLFQGIRGRGAKFVGARLAGVNFLGGAAACNWWLMACRYVYLDVALEMVNA